jgi:hypothetical protein
LGAYQTWFNVNGYWLVQRGSRFIKINFSLLNLITKEVDVVAIKQKFRPISLSNCSFKILSKCATNRLGVVSESLISANQIFFIN